MMASAAEPRFARIAALLADPSRARMLALLLAGEARSAGLFSLEHPRRVYSV